MNAVETVGFVDLKQKPETLQQKCGKIFEHGFTTANASFCRSGNQASQSSALGGPVGDRFGCKTLLQNGAHTFMGTDDSGFHEWLGGRVSLVESVS